MMKLDRYGISQEEENRKKYRNNTQEKQNTAL
jgi:hypothetical protein